MKHAVLYGALLFVLLLFVIVNWVWPILLPMLGFLGAAGSSLALLILTWLVYAWLVKKTGAKPSL